MLSLIDRLRREKFDLVIDLQCLFRTAALAWLSGCRKRFGMADARELAHIFYTHRISQDQNCTHAVDHYLKTARAAGASDNTIEFALPQDQCVDETIKKLLKSHNIDHGRYAVFIICSAHKDKCWPIERFAAVADKVSSDLNLSIIATGTESEKSMAERLQVTASVPILNLAGKISIRELTALLRSSRLVVSNDTGPGHIAAALGRPLVMIFGRSNPVRVAPYRRNNCIVAIEPNERGLKPSNLDPKYDITNITVDDVYKKVIEQIKLSDPDS